MRLATLHVLSAIAAPPTLAQELPPPLKPRQDVTITYRVPNRLFPGGKLRLRTLGSAATGRQRQENAGLVGITDPHRPGGRDGSGEGGAGPARPGTFRPAR